MTELLHWLRQWRCSTGDNDIYLQPDWLRRKFWQARDPAFCPTTGVFQGSWSTLLSCVLWYA